MSISDKLRHSLAIEVKHYIDCKDTPNCDRCKKLVKDMRVLKHD